MLDRRYKIDIYVKILAMGKMTYQPKPRKHSKVHGFLKRMMTATGRNVVKRRRSAGRTKLTA